MDFTSQPHSPPSVLQARKTTATPLTATPGGPYLSVPKSKPPKVFKKYPRDFAAQLGDVIRIHHQEKLQEKVRQCLPPVQPKRTDRREEEVERSQHITHTQAKHTPKQYSRPKGTKTSSQHSKPQRTTASQPSAYRHSSYSSSPDQTLTSYTPPA